MKINVNFTLELSDDEVRGMKRYLEDLGTDETIRDYVKSSAEAMILGEINERTYDMLRYDEPVGQDE